jgi:ABC-type sulfate/molybdate transport systems ATPase subunit
VSLVKNLHADYGDFKIEIPKWEILDSGVTALWGPSGSGKTSVFRLLLGLEPTPGLSWIFQNQDLAQLPTSERKLGVVFQNFELFPHMTAEENIRFGAEARKLPSAETERHLQKLVQILKLESCIGRRASLLSGGEKQRVALARALAGRPRILFLDEPFSALDSDLRAEARELVRHVVEVEGIPTVLITHDREDLQALSSKVSEIRDGRLV